MEFMYGVITALLFLLPGLAYFIGYEKGNKRACKPPDSDLEEIRKAKEMRKEFMELMNYDVNKALQRKKVT